MSKLKNIKSFMLETAGENDKINVTNKVNKEDDVVDHILHTSGINEDYNIDKPFILNEMSTTNFYDKLMKCFKDEPEIRTKIKAIYRGEKK